MANVALTDPPAQLKAIQSFMKVASDIERVEPIVSYWVRLYATETALKIDRESPESKKYLGTLLEWLEQFKQSSRDNEAVTNQTVGQAHYENFVFNLFNKADTIDRNGAANKSTVVMFYMATVLFEAMTVFGPVSDEMTQRAKYAKFKAAYLQKCFRTGQTPKPGPIEDLDDPAGSQTNDAGGLPIVPGSSSNEPGKPTAGNSADKDKNSDPYIMAPSLPPQAPLPYEPQPPKLPSSTPNKPPAVSSSSDQPTPNNRNSLADTSKSSTSGGKSTIASTRFKAMNGAPLNPEDLIKSQKFCKFANSALLYDDIPTAVANLEKALKLLTTGQNSD